MLRLAVMVMAVLLLAASPSSAAPLFDDVSRADFTSNRIAENSPLAAITVSSPTSINQIGARVDLNGAGNLKFLIFDLSSQALLFATGPNAYADDGLSYKVSPVFADFVLNPGIVYGVGAIADVAGFWSINNTSAGNDFTQNSITADDDRNGNVSNFATPALVAEGTAMIMVQLYGGPAQAVPEPATLGLVAAGFGMLTASARRLQRRRS